LIECDNVILLLAYSERKCGTRFVKNDWLWKIETAK